MAKVKYSEDVTKAQKISKVVLTILGIFLGITFIVPFLLILINYSFIILIYQKILAVMLLLF